jgi:hypothetical protein
MEMLTKFTSPGLAFILTLIFGLLLSKAGKPYNGILFNIHKLIALGAAIVTSMQIYKLFNILEFQTLIFVLLVIATICVIALFASGAFMSIGNSNYQAMKLMHNIAPVLALIAMAAIIYMLSVLKSGS